jgi:hypothetical protein
MPISGVIAQRRTTNLNDDQGHILYFGERKQPNATSSPDVTSASRRPDEATSGR